MNNERIASELLKVAKLLSGGWQETSPKTYRFRNKKEELAVVGFVGKSDKPEVLGYATSPDDAHVLIRKALRKYGGRIDDSPYSTIDIISPGETKTHRLQGIEWVDDDEVGSGWKWYDQEQEQTIFPRWSSEYKDN